MTDNIHIHPGRIIFDECLEPLGLSIEEGAKHLRVETRPFKDLIKGKTGISPEMAERLEEHFWGTAKTWMALQNQFDKITELKAHHKES